MTSATHPSALYMLPPLDLSSDEGGSEDCPLTDFEEDYIPEEDSPDDYEEYDPDDYEEEDLCLPRAA